MITFIKFNRTVTTTDHYCIAATQSELELFEKLSPTEKRAWIEKNEATRAVLDYEDIVDQSEIIL